jgi:N-acyl-D-amino-acid deacylase
VTRRVAAVLAALASAALAGAGVLAQAAAQPERAAPERFDVIIRGGHVLDGTGNPWFSADVGIRGDRIAAVGRLTTAQAARVIDARGQVVVPGFIDLHSHADDNDFHSSAGIPPERHNQGPLGTLRDPNARRRAAANIVTQGVTTVVVNQDGSAPWPVSAQRAALERLRIGVNTVLLVGHNAVREQVMGTDFRRAARPDELDRMRALVRQGMQEGAFGLSAALEYVPAIWSTTDEMVALVGEIVPFAGVYIQHERSSGDAPMWWKPSQGPPRPPTVLDAIREVIEIGERTGARVVTTHMKARGIDFWGTSRAVIETIERARARGVEVFGDQYPYNTSGSDGNVVLIPDWSIQFDQWGTIATDATGSKHDFAAALRRTLKDESQKEKVRRDIAHEIQFRGGPENVVIFEYPDKALIGKNLAELAATRHKTAVEVAIDLQLEGFADQPGGGRMRGFSFSEADVEAFAAQPWVATSSDGGIALPEDGPDVHPRFYGTFPRKIRRYALDKPVMSVEHAVRAATSLPAQILGLRDRGLIREGLAADIAVLDLTRLRDRATYVEPHQYAQGVTAVLVGGQFVVDAGQPTWQLPGKVLTPDRARSSR